MTEIQSLLFDNQKWTTKNARKWMAKNNYKPIKRVDKKINWLRYRQTDPKKYKSFRTIELNKNKGIMAVIGIK